MIDATSAPFWTAGSEGKLLVTRCPECRRWAHPPASTCPGCGAPTAPEPVSGRGTVYSYTVDHKQFHPLVPPPYVVALVELEEDKELRLITNLVACEPEELRCGLPVEVCFERHDDVHVPVFRPSWTAPPEVASGPSAQDDYRAV